MKYKFEIVITVDDGSELKTEEIEDLKRKFLDAADHQDYVYDNVYCTSIQ